MADESAVVHDILTIGKHICEEVRRNIFVADRETAERLWRNKVMRLCEFAHNLNLFIFCSSLVVLYTPRRFCV